jgi:hypothetical protein
MAELYWNWKTFELSEAADGIGEMYDGLAQQMQQAGWQNVQHQADVHGYKPGIDLFAAVLYLPIAGREFWQIIAVGGDANQQQAQQEIQEIQQLINRVLFL